MRKELLNKLCCPLDKASLALTTYAENSEGEVTEGILVCTKCHRYYPIIYGLPILSPDEYREKSLEAPHLAKWGLVLPEQPSNSFLIEPDGLKLLEQ